MLAKHSRKPRTESLLAPQKDLPLPPDCRLRLPPELMCHVFRYLPTESIVSLSLTCKVFYFKYFHTTTPIPGPLVRETCRRRVRQTLLIWLEKDIPGVAYCYNCHRLHPWRPVGQAGNGERSPFSTTHQRYCKANTAAKTRFLAEPFDQGPWPTFPLSFYTAHLAMNAVRYGPDHGPSLDSLKVNQTVTDIMHKVVETVRWELKVIDDELYVHGQSNLRHLHGNAAELYKHLSSNQKRLTCRHMAMAPVSVCCGPLGRCSALFEDLSFPESPRDPGPTSSCAFWIGKNPVRSCKICWTDFQIEIRQAKAALATSTGALLPVVYHRVEHEPFDSDSPRHPWALDWKLLDRDPNDYIVTINQWVRLGPCKNPRTEKTWQTRIYACTNRCADAVRYRPADRLRSSPVFTGRGSFRGGIVDYLRISPPSRPVEPPGNVMLRWYGLSDDVEKVQGIVQGLDVDDDDQPLAVRAALRRGRPRYANEYPRPMLPTRPVYNKRASTARPMAPSPNPPPRGQSGSTASSFTSPTTSTAP